MVATWPCKEIDLDWEDWTFALGACLSPSPVQEVSGRVERLWSGESESLACLTVRSAFDLYLRAQALGRRVRDRLFRPYGAGHAAYRPAPWIAPGAARHRSGDQQPGTTMRLRVA